MWVVWELISVESRRDVGVWRGVLTKDDQGRFRFDAWTLALALQGGLMTFPGDSTGFKHLRTAEIKHGRFAMMAATGSLFAHFVKLPGFEDVPTGLAALNTTKGAEGFALLFFLIAGHEAVTWKPQKGEPGSFGDPFAWKQFTPEMRTKVELNNGRMAMFAIIGQIVAELQTGYHTEYVRNPTSAPSLFNPKVRAKSPAVLFENGHVGGNGARVASRCPFRAASATDGGRQAAAVASAGSALSTDGSRDIWGMEFPTPSAWL
ncbi:Fucoxanthin-chlorophyll a-c binding protein A, chloroplastic [Symbiodinium microadriaticum]|uniref:Fucoxanthin-chlorophyll a-c binding protein A, chloroplastic n=1 Tax=Symbiodinium microadriaticum TaxID=2951 RepID=A0A1Q9D830_SYMMI|nr:Fucoxanthin-chlorophyll a-c binding protein A, chloroplastic [Symbiodinium microadriaticum]